MQQFPALLPVIRPLPPPPALPAEVLIMPENAEKSGTEVEEGSAAE